MSDDIARNLIEKFRAITLERLERLTLAVLDLENDREDDNARQLLQRELHTLKGEAKMMGFADVNLVSHRLEDVVKGALARDEALPAGFGDLMLGGLDAIRQLMQKSSSDVGSIDLHALLREFDDFLGNRPAGSDTSELTKSAAAPTQRMPSRRGAGIGTSTLSLFTRSQDSAIRIEIESLDRLLAQAGDLILSHNRATQRLTALRQVQDAARAHLRLSESLARASAHAAAGSEAAEAPTSSFDAVDVSGSSTGTRTTMASAVLDVPAASARDTLAERARQAADSARHLYTTLDRTCRAMRDDAFRMRQQLEQMESGVKELRLLPVGTVFHRFPRAVRDLAKERGKEVRIEIVGETESLDKRILDKIGEPLLHLIRNAIDHGLETPAERLAAAKPAEGVLSLGARTIGPVVEIEVIDDGRGIDAEAVRDRAVANGTIPADDAARLSSRGALELVFEPGFSTAPSVTDVSGRGMGLDVVRDTVEGLGGMVALFSEVGLGTRFLLRLPVRVAVGTAQIVRIGQDRVAVPSEDIDSILRAHRDDLVAFGKGRGIPIRQTGTATAAPRQPARDEELSSAEASSSLYADETVALAPGARDELIVPVLSLARLLDRPVADVPDVWNLVVVRHGGRRLGLRVDDLLGVSEILHRPFDTFLAGVEAFSGTTILPDGGIVPIANVVELMRLSERGAAYAPRGLGVSTTPFEPREWRGEEEPRERTVLLVEDSDITRELLVEILRHRGLAVAEARDGQEGLETLRQRRVDLVITDIDMPHLDGFGMLERMRAQPEWYDLPVIVLTTRGSDEDKQRALNAGANAYLVKTDFREATLSDAVQRLLGS